MQKLLLQKVLTDLGQDPAIIFFDDRGEYYDAIVELADKWAEAYQGCYDIITGYPKDFHLATDPVKYLTQIKEFVNDIRKDLPQDSELNNLVDGIADQIDSTLYKLRFLK